MWKGLSQQYKSPIMIMFVLQDPNINKMAAIYRRGIWVWLTECLIECFCT